MKKIKVLLEVSLTKKARLDDIKKSFRLTYNLLK